MPDSNDYNYKNSINKKKLKKVIIKIINEKETKIITILLLLLYYIIILFEISWLFIYTCFLNKYEYIID